MSKATITILGLIGHTIKEDYIDDNSIKSRFIDKSENDKAEYSFKDLKEYRLIKNRYINMLPLLCDITQDEIIALGTEKAIEIQKKVIEYSKNDANIEYITIPYENDFGAILSQINTLLQNYDEVIFDVSHGFRHLPILATVSLIAQNIQNTEKIKHILFAQEIDLYKKYEIIDLIQYLDLANVSFLLANFKENYTTVKHISIKNKKYHALRDSMNQFSSDLMALSLEHLLECSVNELINNIDKLLKDDSVILKKELEILKTHIKNVFTKKAHRYETYYKIAVDLNLKGYVAQALSLLFEGVGFYIKTSFSKYSIKLKDFIDLFEEKIKNKQQIKDGYPKIADYYTLTSSCRSYVLYPQIESNEQKANNDKLLNNYANEIYTSLNTTKEFKLFAEKIGELRNNLLHSNSGDTINDVQVIMTDIIKNYDKFCIQDDILKKSQKKTIETKTIQATTANNSQKLGLRVVKKAKSK